MEKILERYGIQVVGGEEINIPKDDIIENIKMKMKNYGRK
jgi:hypothetical protein